jgi:nucleoside-diphosphate-sugar epimerase
MGKITLVGAAGAIGNSIAATLRSQGTEYRVVGRNRASLSEAFGADRLAEIATWNPDDPDSVKEAVRSSDVLVYLVGVPYNHFELHPVLMRQTLSGAVSEGVGRVLLIGTVYPYGLPRTNPVTEAHPREPHTFKGRMRKEQEDILLEAHSLGKIRGAILRLPDFYGPNVERSFLQGLFQAAAQAGTANMVGPIDTPHEFVFVPDVGPVVAQLISKPAAWGRGWNLAGAGITTQRAMADRVFALAGSQPKLRVAGKNILRVIGLFNPIMREMVEMHYLQTNPVLLDDSALCGLLGPIHKTSYEDGVRICFEAAKAANARAV